MPSSEKPKSMDHLNRVHRVTASPYGDHVHPSEEELNRLLGQGWLIKEMHVVKLEAGGGSQTKYDTLYWLNAPLPMTKKLKEAWEAEKGK